MIHRIHIKDLMNMPGHLALADVRTPAEFNHGHIPGARNIPLFSNEERVQVGTTYKQTGKEAAILLGFDLTGAKWSGFIRQALETAPEKKIALHCWRGGMRSGAMAWALDLYGFEVWLLEGGYKSYRRWVHRQFEEPYRFSLIGGMTGSGKTNILHQLRLLGEQVVDLEDLARHRGSSYGTMNKLVQPTQEQFENGLADQLYRADRKRKIWVEDESITIGKCSLPKPFWNQMQAAILFDIQVPAAQRVQTLVREYGVLDKAFLAECTARIRKRLGGEQTKHAIAAIWEDRMDEFIRLVLVYYDKTYRSAMNSRSPGSIVPVSIEYADPTQNAREILALAPAIPPLSSNPVYTIPY